METNVLNRIALFQKPRLYQTLISEMQMYVASKFRVSLPQVRNAIWQKLNTEKKVGKKVCK